MSERPSRRPKGEKFRLTVPLDADPEQDLELVPVDETTQDTDNFAATGDNVEPDLVQTHDGRLIIEMKAARTCLICNTKFPTAKSLAKHKLVCFCKEEVFKDVLQKEKAAAMVAQPGEEFFKYCNPTPENPCYCCGEDKSTAHVGHMQCKFCPKSFKAFEYMEKHLASVHAESDAFACAQCNARCSSAAVLEGHMETHSEGKPFSCLKCGKDFTRKYHLDRHLNHSSCGDIPKQTLPCEVCGKEFTRLDNLREHLRFHMGQSSRRRDYQCPYCPKSFYGSSLLNIHIRTHTGEKPFPCDLCNKSFPSTGALRKHRRCHTGERPYRCDQCSGTFSARETLNRHRKTHTGERPHHCTMCDKRFIQATQLRAHMFNHTGENGFACIQCDAAFGRKARLEEHIRFVHNSEERITCDVCNKGFLRYDDLKRHSVTHNKVKKHACDKCGKKFMTKHAVKLHDRIHEIEDPVDCNICGHQFLRHDCLVRHIRSKHTGKNPVKIEKTATEKAPPPPLQRGEEVLEIGGEVYQITPVDNIQIVQITPQSTATEMQDNGTRVEILEVVEMDPPNEKLEAISVKQKPKTKTEVKCTTITASKSPQQPETAASKKQETDPVTSQKKVVHAPKKRLRASNPIPSKKIKIEEQDNCMPIFLSDTVLKDKVAELLCLLIDEDTLAEFGWPTAPVDEVLVKVIIQCGSKPASDTDSGDCTTRLRENTKILFSLTMDDDNIKTLLNNHTVDEVIMDVLKNK
ncbi:oocyte zinc finger protein XlCOF6 [Sabethes cyaneus]|uniref:oocyte zinc finger protein XlCOF6 n=1 Tax=Sabethes cyaneus TaxID=53552 RepID=UPI00237E1326|nr:oocyte zinc finger protein XlCOF6 [Sabethes cyaneus]